MTAHRYEVFGLALRSARPLRGLTASSRPGERDDIEIALGARPAWADAPVMSVVHSSPAPDGDPPVVVVEGLGAAGVRFAYGEGIRFHVSSALDGVWADWDAPLDESDAMTFLLGPVLGYLLRARGVLALHASAVEIDGRLTGFVGPAGAGKSTLAAGLAARGHAVLSDDVLALRESKGAWVAWPAHDQVRLWDASVAMLFGEGHRLPPLSPSWEKRELSLRESGMRFQDEPRPLRALVLLDGDPGAVDAPVITSEGGNEALLSLIGNTYVSYLLEPQARARELEAIADLAARTPIGRLRRPADGGEPTAVVGAVEHWVRHVTS